MRRRVRVHYSLVLVALCCACTIKIPPESIALSRTVTTNIKDLQQKHANLVDAYFELRFGQLDEWFRTVYEPAYQTNYVTVWNAARPADQFDISKPAHRSSYVSDAIAEYEEIKAELTQTKNALMQALGLAYVDLIAANEAVTTILLSAEAVTEAQRGLWDSTVGQVFPNFDSAGVDRALCEIENKRIQMVGGPAMTC